MPRWQQRQSRVRRCPWLCLVVCSLGSAGSPASNTESGSYSPIKYDGIIIIHDRFGLGTLHVVNFIAIVWE